MDPSGGFSNIYHVKNELLEPIEAVILLLLVFDLAVRRGSLSNVTGDEGNVFGVIILFSTSGRRAAARASSNRRDVDAS
jgi:hypothetical protein